MQRSCADARWGRPAHITFFFFCILTNILVTSMLLLGGAAVMNSLTGMNIYAVRLLKPSTSVCCTCRWSLAPLLKAYKLQAGFVQYLPQCLATLCALE